MGQTTEQLLPLTDTERGELSQSEQERLDYLEERIGEGIEVFTRVGMDLKEIRDRRLYRAEHGTFEAYCRSRWNLDRAYAYELIGAASIAGELSGIPDTPAPTAPAQVRPLKQLPDPEERREVWQEAVQEAGGKTPTAAAVKKVVERRKPAEKTALTIAIPESARAAKDDMARARAAAKRTNALVAEARACATAEQRGHAENPPVVRAVTEEMIAHIKAKSAITDAAKARKNGRFWVEALREGEGWRQLADEKGRPFRSWDHFCTYRQPFGLGYAPGEIAEMVGEPLGKKKTNRDYMREWIGADPDDDESGDIFDLATDEDPTLFLDFIHRIITHDGERQHMVQLAYLVAKLNDEKLDWLVGFCEQEKHSRRTDGSE